ncbi:hypothetical protein BRADI_1g09280v3 [Brachypodium distachyon]|uniref:NPH3 domain-containing protein n=1 Tax=Brachypodium distachyon TaxID=15368 RepID=I1GNI5_BRADI|nr:hypothetical protein BRADI_1g09280v3 [Brachypodium distachyon]
MFVADEFIHKQAHPRLAAEERDRVCGVVDCRKLTVEACTHTAQNERLPLRAVLQVLFFEQLQQRRRHLAGGPATSEAWRASALQESQVLRVDMDGVRRQVQGLERDANANVEDEGDWPASWRSRYECKFSTQVCDLQACNLVAASRAYRMAMSP